MHAACPGCFALQAAVPLFFHHPIVQRDTVVGLAACILHAIPIHTSGRFATQCMAMFPTSCTTARNQTSRAQHMLQGKCCQFWCCLDLDACGFACQKQIASCVWTEALQRLNGLPMRTHPLHSIGTSEWEGLAPSMSHLRPDRLSFQIAAAQDVRVLMRPKCAGARVC